MTKKKNLKIFTWKQYDKSAKKTMKVNQLGKYFHMDRITLFVPFWFFEILFIGEFKPKLNKQSDSMGAKVFTTTSVMPVGCSDH